MKTIIRWLLAALLIVTGIYALSASIGTMGEYVVLLGDHRVPYTLAVIVGLGGLGAGVLSLLSALTGRRRWL